MELLMSLDVQCAIPDDAERPTSTEARRADDTAHVHLGGLSHVVRIPTLSLTDLLTMPESNTQPKSTNVEVVISDLPSTTTMDTPAPPSPPASKVSQEDESSEESYEQDEEDDDDGDDYEEAPRSKRARASKPPPKASRTKHNTKPKVSSPATPRKRGNGGTTSAAARGSGAKKGKWGADDLDKLFTAAMGGGSKIAFFEGAVEGRSAKQCHDTWTWVLVATTTDG